MKKTILSVIGVISLSGFHFVHAEGLGRLFTSPAERAMLEKMRQPVIEQEKTQKYDPIKIVIHDEPKPAKIPLEKNETKPEETTPVVEEKPIVEEKKIVYIERPDLPEITVNGLVKRSNGLSTAWVNGISTDSGYLETQNIVVNPRRIGRDHVHVEVDDVIMEDISLKVGQTLDPDQAKVTDLYESEQASQ